jgi:predicted PhzF superfamily epimerase YddE/YHI9
VETSATGITVSVVRVFTNQGGEFGNLLGIVDGKLVPPRKRQRAAAQIGYSETVFIDDAAAGRVQIFTPTIELPFAGHPTVGTAWWLRQQGYAAERLLTAAGALEITADDTLTWVRARAEWAPEFVWHDLADPAAVQAADPSAYTTGQHYLWAWVEERMGTVRSRMFAPAMGIVEDEATGSAAIALTAKHGRDLDITQGRGSRVHTTWDGDGWVKLGGLVAHEPPRTLSL